MRMWSLIGISHLSEWSHAHAYKGSSNWILKIKRKRHEVGRRYVGEDMVGAGGRKCVVVTTIIITVSIC